MNPFNTLAQPILDKYPELIAEDLSFSPAPKLEVGDVALRCFVPAKKLNMPPPKFAASLSQEVSFGPEVVSVEAAGPYVNFRLDRGAFGKDIVRSILAEGPQFGSKRSGAGQSLLIEHTSINPNASPHVGRARNAIIGDSLVRLFRFEEYEVDVHYYVNDMGRQIGLLVLQCPNLAELSFDDVLDAYVAANERAEADEDFAAQGYELLVKMEQGDPETRERFAAITTHCLNGQLEVLARLGITYDTFDRESAYLNDERLKVVLDALKERDAIFTDEDGRLVVDMSKLGHDREEGRYFVLMRANGSSLYGYRDLAYTVSKLEQGADTNLWILGEDHKLYAYQQSLILAAAGYTAPETIHYAYILLKEGKMSTRQGKVVLLSDFLDEATRRSAEKVFEQYDDLSAEEGQRIAEKIAASAVRFAILKVGLNKNVIFDWETSLSFTGDTGPYVQYSCARINSILRKFGDADVSDEEDFPIQLDAEWALVTKLAAFPDIVAGALAQRSCSGIAQYALETARLFTAFYHECPVLTAESQALVSARVQVCRATRQTLINALAILGIDVLDRM